MEKHNKEEIVKVDSARKLTLDKLNMLQSMIIEAQFPRQDIYILVLFQGRDISDAITPLLSRLQGDGVDLRGFRYATEYIDAYKRGQLIDGPVLPPATREQAIVALCRLRAKLNLNDPSQADIQ